MAIEHDSRDNIFTPNRGWIGAAEATFYDPRLGSDNDFQAIAVTCSPTARRRGRSARAADGRAARGDVPFYMLPFIDMRGIPAARFQDDNVAVLEAEVRYDMTERWSLVGFFRRRPRLGRP